MTEDECKIIKMRPRSAATKIEGQVIGHRNDIGKQLQQIDNFKMHKRRYSRRSKKEE